MTYVRSFDNAQPPERFDELPYTLAIVQEAPDVDGTPPLSAAFVTRTTITLATGVTTPVATGGVTPTGNDTDPAAPLNRDITATTATIATGGWYRIVWQDATGAQAEGDPVQHGTAATGEDLTSVAALRRLLQTPDDQTGQNPLYQDLITEASVMIRRDLGRQFAAESAATKTFAYAGRGRISLAPYDLRVITAISYDAEGTSPVALTETQWLLRSSTQDGVYRQVFLPDYTSDTVSSTTSPVVSITGDWGFAEIPADVERGCKITVKTWLREGATFTPDGDVIRFERVGRVPQDVLDGLQHYRLPTVG